MLLDTRKNFLFNKNSVLSLNGNLESRLIEFIPHSLLRVSTTVLDILYLLLHKRTFCIYKKTWHYFFYFEMQFCNASIRIVRTCIIWKIFSAVCAFAMNTLLEYFLPNPNSSIPTWPQDRYESDRTTSKDFPSTSNTDLITTEPLAMFASSFAARNSLQDSSRYKSRNGGWGDGVMVAVEGEME